MRPSLSIIVPVLNDATALERLLNQIYPLLDESNELIVVDGGSQDASASLANKYPVRVVVSEAGRAKQMNAGAKVAKGELLWFLHADSEPTTMSVNALKEASNINWGFFSVRLSGSHFMFRMIEQLINLRSGLTRVATGDQGIFMTRIAFNTVNGFPDIDLMEDVALSKQLRKHFSPIKINNPLLTSSRRWEKHGIVSTILLMWWLRLLYFLGVDPAKLARKYCHGK